MADEILIYLPGSQRQDLPEDFVIWTWAFDPWDAGDELSQNGEDKLTQSAAGSSTGGAATSGTVSVTAPPGAGEASGVPRRAFPSGTPILRWATWCTTAPKRGSCWKS